MRKLGLFFLLLIFLLPATAQETVTISGRVTDFDGMPMDSATVSIKYTDFSDAYQTLTDKDGYYTLSNVEKGSYIAMFAMRMKEYPKMNAVAPEDMRLEFWTWNLIADRDLTINPRYHRVEVYGVNIFKVEGAYPGLMIYFRPMSTGRLIDGINSMSANGVESGTMPDVSIRQEHMEVKVFADDIPQKINTIQKIDEYSGTPGQPVAGYLLHVDKPASNPGKPYIVYRIEVTNREHNEKGECIYFYEPKDYKENIN